MPSEDIDPVRSPEDAGQAAEEQEHSSSSSLAGMGSLLPSPDDDTQPGKRNRKGAQIEPEHHETASEDENVGNYYLDNKNWKAALSRFESALVLDPDNPDVYWGLAESQRHLGDFASARANYLKVTQYDPDSRHAKEARKALKEPEIANAKASSSPSPRSAAAPVYATRTSFLGYFSLWCCPFTRMKHLQKTAWDFDASAGKLCQNPAQRL